jgi:hypothetical protein
LRRVAAPSAVAAGTVVVADGAPEAGVITSAAVADDDGTAAIVRVRWSSAGADLRTAAGVDLVTVGSLD